MEVHEGWTEEVEGGRGWEEVMVRGLDPRDSLTVFGERARGALSHPESQIPN